MLEKNTPSMCENCSCIKITRKICEELFWWPLVAHIFDQLIVSFYKNGQLGSVSMLCVHQDFEEKSYR